jgi:hypothetical protein
MGRVLEKIRARQTVLLRQLRELDEEADVLVQRRRELVGALRQCRDAIGGVGHHWIGRDPMPTEVDAEPAGTVPIIGADLRAALRLILVLSERPMTVPDLHRALLARGLRPGGRPSKAISDALRAEVARGRAARVGRGEYVSAERAER